LNLIHDVKHANKVLQLILLVYLCAMLPAGDLQQRWLDLELKLLQRLGKTPDLDEVLLFIGIKESGMPPKNYSETEKFNLTEMALHTILVPAGYYELFWVDDVGWPHYRQLQPLDKMSNNEREYFLKTYILMYTEKNKLV
jgi:hypothetical protein